MVPVCYHLIMSLLGINRQLMDSADFFQDNSFQLLHHHHCLFRELSYNFRVWRFVFLNQLVCEHYLNGYDEGWPYDSLPCRMSYCHALFQNRDCFFVNSLFTDLEIWSLAEITWERASFISNQSIQAKHHLLPLLRLARLWCVLLIMPVWLLSEVSMALGFCHSKAQTLSEKRNW